MILGGWQHSLTIPLSTALWLPVFLGRAHKNRGMIVDGQKRAEDIFFFYLSFCVSLDEEKQAALYHEPGNNVVTCNDEHRSSKDLSLSLFYEFGPDGGGHRRALYLRRTEHII